MSRQTAKAFLDAMRASCDEQLRVETKPPPTFNSLVGTVSGDVFIMMDTPASAIEALLARKGRAQPRASEQ